MPSWQVKEHFLLSHLVGVFTFLFHPFSALSFAPKFAQRWCEESSWVFVRLPPKPNAIVIAWNPPRQIHIFRREFLGQAYKRGCKLARLVQKCTCHCCGHRGKSLTHPGWPPSGLETIHQARAPGSDPLSGHQGRTTPPPPPPIRAGTVCSCCSSFRSAKWEKISERETRD